MREIKYYQGFSDAFALMSPAFKTMLSTIKETNDYNEVLRIITQSFYVIGDCWKESNDKISLYVDNIAKTYDLKYDPETEYLFVDETNQTICVKKYEENQGV